MITKTVEFLLGRDLSVDDRGLVFNVMRELEQVRTLGEQATMLAMVKAAIGQGLLEDDALVLEVIDWRYMHVVRRSRPGSDYIDVETCEEVPRPTSKMRAILALDLVRLRHG